MTIRKKLIIYLFTSIFLSLLAAGIALDRTLTSTYHNRSSSNLDQVYRNFVFQQEKVRESIIDNALHVSSDRLVTATINIANHYQKAANYYTLVLDTDKKKIANFLLRHISISQSNHVSIYDKKGILVAFAVSTEQQKLAGIQSYHQGKTVYLGRPINGAVWNNIRLPARIDASIQPLNEDTAKSLYNGEMSYQQKGMEFIVESNRSITRIIPGKQRELLGVVRVAKSIDSQYLANITGNTDAQLSLWLASGKVINKRPGFMLDSRIRATKPVFGELASDRRNLITTDHYNMLSYRWPTREGIHYLIVSIPNKDLVSVLNSTRSHLGVIFITIMVITFFVGLYWLNKLVTKPLNNLVQQADTIKEGGYPVFQAPSANDEIGRLGRVLTSMVDTIKARENDLTNRTEKLNNAQRIARVGDWELDHDTGCMTWSDEVFRIMGLKPGCCTPTRKKIIERLHPDDKEYTLKAFDDATARHIPFNVTHRLLLEEETVKYIQAFGETFYHSDGSPSRSIGTMQDITESVLKDEQLRRNQKMDAIGQLTGGIAHDFNNMLGVILGFAGILDQETDSGDTRKKKHISEITHAAKRAQVLTSKLLSFSKKDTSTFEVVDMNSVLTSERHMLEKTLTVRIQLNLDLEENLWPVWIDKNELEDSIVNMAINSMHAMPVDGKLTLCTRNIFKGETISLHIALPASDYVLLSIIDTGIGMNAETRQHIFEPFFTTKEEKGTGLGMSQVYGFVKRSSGIIDILSEPGHGTRIDIYLPRYTGKLVVKPGEVEADSKQLQGTSNILVVDDERALRDLAYEVLSKNGYHVLTADSGHSALKILETEKVDLLLSDIIMPDMNGFQLACEVEERYPGVKIQFVSGYPGQHDSEIVDSDLYQASLQKPFKAEVLLEKVKQRLLTGENERIQG